MPPPFASPSLITDFLGLRRRDGVELPQHVGGDRHRLPEHDLTDIDGDIRRGVDRRGEGGGGGRKAMPAFIAIGIELQMREMQRLAAGRLDRCDRGRDIAWNAEIVAVQMHRMRDFEIADRLLQGLDDLARGETVEGHDVVETKRPHIVFERGRAAGIDAFEAKPVARRKGGADIIGDGRRSFACRAARTTENHHCRAPSASPCR